MKLINFFKIFCMKWVSFCCTWQEEPGILISMLLHCVLVCNQHPFGLPLTMDGMHRTQFDDSHLDRLSLVIWSSVLWPSDHVKLAQSTAVCIGAKAFWPLLIVAFLRNLWLLQGFQNYSWMWNCIIQPWVHNFQKSIVKLCFFISWEMHGNFFPHKYSTFSQQIVTASLQKVSSNITNQQGIPSILCCWPVGPVL